jgi:hypothetical protein
MLSGRPKNRCWTTRHVGAIADRASRVFKRVGLFRHWEGISSQESFVALMRPSRVRNDIADLEKDNTASDHVLAGNGAGLSFSLALFIRCVMSENGRHRAAHGFKRSQGLLCLLFLCQDRKGEKVTHESKRCPTYVISRPSSIPQVQQ